jgi:hypothetical protein
MKEHTFPATGTVLSMVPWALLCLMLSVSLLAGCATTTQAIRYQGLASAPKLSATDHSGDILFAYSTGNSEWTKYTDFVLDPVEIYTGHDSQLGGVSAEDQAKLAEYMQVQFNESLTTRFHPVSEATPQTLRIHLTLTGVETNTPMLSTLINVLPVGLLINSVKSANGTQASFSGSVSYAVEIYDGASGRLLRAYVAKKYPMAVNIAASLGALNATKAGIRNGAETMLEQMH